MKKLTSIILTLSLLLALFVPIAVVPVTAAEEYTEGYYTYTVTDGKATITDCNTSISGDVTIPSALGGYPVTSIGYYAFSYCTGLTSVTIPDSVMSIGVEAFLYCTA